jgi:hypothetical protein
VSIQDIWKRVFATRYTRALEGEVARLRAENRALLNSILGIAGIPPVIVDSLESKMEGSTVGSATTPNTRTPERTAASPWRRKLSVGAVPRQQSITTIPSPVRHRSWQQVNRMLELDAIRKNSHSRDNGTQTK